MQFVNGTLVLKNISPSEEDINIIGYKIISAGTHPLLNNMITIESTIISKGDQQAIYIPFPPEKIFDMQLYTSNGYYLDVKNVTATSSSPIFAKVFGDDGDNSQHADNSNLMIQTSDGGYLIAGYTNLFDLSNDIWLIKLKQDGILDWNIAFGGNDYDCPYSLIETSDNGYLVLGITSSDEGYQDIWLLKVNDNGVLDWNTTFGGVSDEYPASLIETSDNKYLILGNTWSYGSGNQDIWLLKINQDGTLDWNKTLGGASREDSISLIETTDNKYLILGDTGSYGAGSDDIWLLKINEDGTLDWNKTFGGASYESPTSLIETNDNKYLISGYTVSFGAGNRDIWVLKVNLEGTLDWNKTFGGASYESPTSLIETNDNKYLISGSTDSYGAGDYDCWLLKINPDGTLDWNNTFGTTNADESKFVYENDNEYFIFGTTQYFFGDEYDTANLYIVNADVNGNLISEKTFGGPGTDYFAGVYETADNGFIAYGSTFGYGKPDEPDCGYTSIFIVKISSTGDIPSTDDLVESKYIWEC